MPRMPSRPTAAVDTAKDPSLSFAPPDRPIGQGQAVERSIDKPGRSRASDAQARTRRPRLIVKGNRPAAGSGDLASDSRASTGGPLGAMPEFPVQISKVQAPPLRDETLARDRLLDW